MGTVGLLILDVVGQCTLVGQCTFLVSLPTFHLGSAILVLINPANLRYLLTNVKHMPEGEYSSSSTKHEKPMPNKLGSG